MNPTKIALVIGQLTAGGAEGQLLEVARALRETPLVPLVYCLSDNTEPVGPEIEAAGVRLRVIPGPEWRRPRRLAHALAEDGVGLVHAWLYIGNSYAWLARLGSSAVPLITSARNCKRQGLLHDVTNRLAFRSSERIVANSEEVARYIERVYGAPRERIAVLHNGVDVARFHPPQNPPEGDPLIVGIGRLVPQKAPDHFVEAAERLRARHPGARFMFLGEGPMRPELMKRIATCGLAGRFELPGVTRDVPAVLRRARLFWLTSAWEGLPNVVLEAQASGVPVIATDVGGTRELVRSGTDGFLVRYGDIDAVVHYSDRLLSDVEAWGRFAAQARARAQRFSTARMTGAVIDLYAEVLGQKGWRRAS